MHHRSLVDLRPIVPQKFALHRRFSRRHLLVPLPVLHDLLGEERNEDATDDDRELARIVAPIVPRLLRLVRHVRPLVVSLGEKGRVGQQAGRSYAANGSFPPEADPSRASDPE